MEGIRFSLTNHWRSPYPVILVNCVVNQINMWHISWSLHSIARGNVQLNLFCWLIQSSVFQFSDWLTTQRRLKSRPILNWIGEQMMWWKLLVNIEKNDYSHNYVTMVLLTLSNLTAVCGVDWPTTTPGAHAFLDRINRSLKTHCQTREAIYWVEWVEFMVCIQASCYSDWNSKTVTVF